VNEVKFHVGTLCHQFQNFGDGFWFVALVTGYE